MPRLKDCLLVSLLVAVTSTATISTAYGWGSIINLFGAGNSSSSASVKPTTPPPPPPPPPPSTSVKPPPPPPPSSSSLTAVPTISVSGTGGLSGGLPSWFKGTSLTPIKGKLRDCTPSWKNFFHGLSLKFISKLFDVDFDFAYFYCEIVNNIANKLHALLPNPEFVIKVPTVVKIGKNGKIDIHNPFNDKLSVSNQNGNAFPIDESEISNCLNGANSNFCSVLTSSSASGNTEEIIGATAGKKLNSQKYKDLMKYADNVTKAIAVGSNVELLNGTTAEDMTGIIALRTGLMNQAVSPLNNVLPGKENLKKVPAPLKNRYNAVAYKGFSRTVYLQSLQKRLQIHYQEIASLQSLISKTCKIPTTTEKPSPLNLSDFTSAISNISNIISHISYDAPPSFKGKTFMRVKFKNEKSKKSIKDFIIDKENLVRALGNPLVFTSPQLIASRGLKSAIVDAVLQGVGAYIATQTGQIGTMFNTGFASGFGAIGNLTAQNGDATRQTMHEEDMETRNLMKAYNCALLRIQLERAMIELDNLETQTAILGALLGMQQQQDVNNYQKEYKKWMLRGVEK